MSSLRRIGPVATAIAAAFSLGGCEMGVQASMRPYVAVPPAPPQPDFCQLATIAGPLPTPGPGIVPVAHIECRYQNVVDSGTCRRQVQKLACNNGANTPGGIQEGPGFIAAEAIYVAPAPPAAAPPPAPVAMGPQPGDPLPPMGLAGP